MDPLERERIEQKRQKEREEAERKACLEASQREDERFRVGPGFEPVTPLGELRSHAGQPVTDVLPRIAKTTTGRGLMTLLYGPPGSGKSTLLRTAVSARYHGRPFLGVEQEPDRSPVLWLTEEPYDLWSDYLEREALPAGDAIRIVNLDRRVTEADPADRFNEWRDWIGCLGSMVKREGIRLVIVDTLMGCMPEANENGYSSMHQWMAGWRSLTKCSTVYGQQEPAVVLTHHSAKRGGPLGSTAIPATTDLRLELSAPDHRGKRTTRTVNQTGRFGICTWRYSLVQDTENGHYDVQLIEGKNEPEKETKPKQGVDPLVVVVVEAVRKNGPSTREEIRKAVKKGNGPVVVALKQAQGEGLLHLDAGKFTLTKLAKAAKQ